MLVAYVLSVTGTNLAAVVYMTCHSVSQDVTAKVRKNFRKKQQPERSAASPPASIATPLKSRKLKSVNALASEVNHPRGKSDVGVAPATTSLEQLKSTVNDSLPGLVNPDATKAAPTGQCPATASSPSPAKIPSPTSPKGLSCQLPFADATKSSSRSPADHNDSNTTQLTTSAAVDTQTTQMVSADPSMAPSAEVLAQPSTLLPVYNQVDTAIAPAVLPSTTPSSDPIDHPVVQTSMNGSGGGANNPSVTFSQLPGSPVPGSSMLTHSPPTIEASKDEMAVKPSKDICDCDPQEMKNVTAQMADQDQDKDSDDWMEDLLRECLKKATSTRSGPAHNKAGK